jgi:hypothetical protein
MKILGIDAIGAMGFDPSFREKEDSASSNSEKEKRSAAESIPIGTLGIAVQVVSEILERKKTRS